MKSVLVIGMGRLGRRLATKMSELGNDVMIADLSEKKINELAPNFVDAYIADCTNESALKSFDIKHFDVCFVTIGDNFQASLEVTSLLKELGAKYVVSKAGSEIQSKFLLKNGADEVFYPERDIADKLAIKHNARNVFDLIELSSEYAIFEIPIKEGWVGNSIQSLDIRKKYHVNVLAIKNNNVINIPTPDYSFVENDHVIVLGKQNDVFKLNSKK